MAPRSENAPLAKRSTSKDTAATTPHLVSTPDYRVVSPGPEFEPLLDSDEAAALLKIHPKTLQKMARKHQIVGIQIGKLWRFRASVLNEWLQQKLAG